jgi:hypothetical protein
MSLLFLKDVKWVDMYKMVTLSGLLIGMVNGVNRTYYNINIGIGKEEYEEQEQSGIGKEEYDVPPMSKLSKTTEYIKNATIDGVIVATYVATLPITLPLYTLYFLYND